MVGGVAIVRLEQLKVPEKVRVAKELLAELKNVTSVYEQRGGIEGRYRLRKLKYLAGARTTLTDHRENGCVFRVDVAKCYFSPRLSTERLKIADEVDDDESVLNMFAGVGPFSIPIAKRRRAKVTSCELNNYASELHEVNNRLNKVDDLVEVVNADVSKWASKTEARFDRILMPHPSQSDRFLPAALRLAKKGARIHYYRHVLGKDEEEGTKALKKELTHLLPPKARYSTRIVREVGPRWLELAADVRLP